MDPALTDRHWPGFTNRTQTYVLAVCYVFIKQSGPPSHCDWLFRVSAQNCQHPLYRRYGTNLPNSLAWCIPDTPEASHLGAPVLVLGTDTEDPSPFLFHGLQRLTKPYTNARPFVLSSVSHHYGTPQIYTLRQSENSV